MDGIATIRFLLSRQIWTWIGLISGILVFGTTATTVSAELLPADFTRLIFVSITLIIWISSWSYNRYIYPRFARNKLGVLVAIDSETDEQKRRIEADLAAPLEKSLNVRLKSSAFSVFTLQPFHAARASNVLYNFSIAFNAAKKIPTSETLAELAEKNKAWARLHRRCRATVYIYGTIKERKDTKDSYFFSIDTLVVHRPVNESTSKLLQRDLINSFPKKASFYKELEFSGFELTTNTLFVAVGFISGIITLLSGDNKTAESMLTALKTEISDLSAGPENAGYIKSRINAVIASCLLTEYHKQIRENVERGLAILDRAYGLASTDYTIAMNKAYAEFVYRRDTGKTLRCLDTARQHAGTDLMWLYNKAFVYLYIGKYRRAAELYKELENASCVGENEIVDECIRTDLTLVQSEPHRTQILFALGFLYAKKRDAANSKKYYAEFLEKSKGNAQLVPLVNKAKKIV